MASSTRSKQSVTALQSLATPPKYHFLHNIARYHTIIKRNSVLLASSWLLFLPLVSAQEKEVEALNCNSATDNYVGNSQKKFTIQNWLQRGICIRAQNHDPVCYATLISVLDNVNSIRAAEYNGSAGVLSLLPTIGALLGAPTNEIWKLKTIVPFGGVLVTLLSFGGAILPTKIEDYENNASRGNETIGSIISLRWRKGAKRGQAGDMDHERETEDKVEEIIKRLKDRMQQNESQATEKGYLWIGFLGMVCLFLASQAAMIITEQGSVLPWWCVSRWWMHFWYGLVTITAFIENYVQLPFSQHWKLLISDIPYDIQFSDGDDIVKTLDEKNGTGPEQALKQLSTLKAADLLLRGRGKTSTQPKNTVMVMVSVLDNVNEQRINAFWRLLSKACSIAIFVTGTAFFASVQLLALPMAVMVLTVVLAAGVFGRAIATWIVTGVEKSEPMIHVIANTTAEASQIIGKILTLDKNVDMDGGDRNVQVEINGHVFVGCRRVAKRSGLWVAILGIMATPFDLRKVSTLKSLLEEATGTHHESVGLLPNHS